MRRGYPILLLCTVLNVKRSCYYAGKAGQAYKIKDKERAMESQVVALFEEHKRRYGSTRVVG
jgi:hypothetical protein